MDSKLDTVLSKQRQITLQEVCDWDKTDPYFVIPKLLALRDSEELSAEQRAEMMKRVAISVGDREELASVLGVDMSCYADFYPDTQKPTTTTTAVIDSFLDTFAPADSKETELLSKVLFSNTPDYAAQLAHEERQSSLTDNEISEESLSEEDKLINRFIAKDGISNQNRHIELDPEAEKSEKMTNDEISAKNILQEPENTSLTESFARVMIKNGNYRKALQIITDLSLNNPEKSIYFADQIRFLKKLIINENN